MACASKKKQINFSTFAALAVLVWACADTARVSYAQVPPTSSSASAPQEQTAQPAANEQMAQPAPSENEKRLLDAFAAARSVAQVGPTKVTLMDQGALGLPEGYVFIPRKEAAQILDALGNMVGENFIGLVLPKDDGLQWFISVDYVAAGYIRDADAKDWKADDMLESLREGVEESNKFSVQRGMPELELNGWLQKPSYDAGVHRLVWSVLAKEKGASAAMPQTVNYHMYMLGREGYFNLNLVTADSLIDKHKDKALGMVEAIQYNQGKQYKDFVEGKDHVAEYGLAALVVGVAAKKIGLLALAGVYLLKFWKLAMVAFFALGVGVKRLFGRNSALVDNKVPSTAQAEESNLSPTKEDVLQSMSQVIKRNDENSPPPAV